MMDEEGDAIRVWTKRRDLRLLRDIVICSTAMHVLLTHDKRRRQQHHHHHQSF